YASALYAPAPARRRDRALRGGPPRGLSTLRPSPMGAIPLKPLHLNGSDMSYYYLAASLPMLSLDGEPPISLEDFLNRCDEHLSKKDRTALDALFSKHDTASRHTFVRAWRDRETQLRNAIVRV